MAPFSSLSRLKWWHFALGAAAIIAFGMSAIIIERALNDLLLDYMNPISVLGLGILVAGGALLISAMALRNGNTIIRDVIPGIFVIIIIGLILILCGIYVGG